MSVSGHESRFQVLERLGRGGTAEVFRVRLTGSGRLAALKRPLPQPLPGIDFNLLARRELSLIGARRFPGLVRILNTTDDGSDYLLLELCEGKTLDQLGQIKDVRLALNILSAVAADLEYLRQHQIIHGDLKPQNIFLPVDIERCSTDKLFFAKLSDFSLGQYEHELDAERAGLGTVGYMAPETIVDGRANHRSDLFALGVIAYQVLTGKHPFIETETDPLRINASVREAEPTPVDQIVPDVPKTVVDVIGRLLMKQPEQRPPTALAVCHMLRQVGATYPFEQLLRPKYLIESRSGHKEAVTRVVDSDERRSVQLARLTQDSPVRLRLLLETNFRKSNLSLTEKGFKFTGDVYWPSRFRREELRNFRSRTFGQRKAAVRTAVSTARGATLFENLLLAFLSPATIFRLSRPAAKLAERAAHYADATVLYVRAGDLESADRCAYQAASLLRGEHRSREAILCINSVLDLATMRDATRSVLPLLMLRGDIQKETGLVDDALVTYQQIISLYAGLPADKLLAETYRDLGDLYKMKQDSKAGLEALNQALTIYKQMGEDLELSRTYNNIGNSYFYAGDIAQSFRHYRRALGIQRRLEATTEIASTLSNLGSVYCLKGNYDRSTRLFEISLLLKRELGNAGEIARTLNNLGYIQYLRGYMDEAVRSLTESLEINRRIGSNKEILFNLENLTSVMLDAGQLRESLRFLSEGIELSNSVNDLPHQFVFSHSMAVTHLRMGKPEEASRSLQGAFQLMERVDDPQAAFQIRLTSAHLRLFVGDFAGARSLAIEARDFAMDRQLRPFVLQAILTLLRIDPTDTMLNEAYELADSLGQTQDRKVARFNMLERLMDAEDYRPESALLTELKLASKEFPHNIDRPRLRNIFGEILLAARDLATAKPLIAQNIHDAKKAGLAPELAQALVLSGQLSFADGDIELAYAQYRQALQNLKGISESIADTSDRATFQSRRVVKFLVAEIRRLSGLLNQKQRAGTPALQ